MAVIGEASVKIIGDLKPLLASFDKAKKELKAFDANINMSLNKIDRLMGQSGRNVFKIDYSAINRMNQQQQRFAQSRSRHQRQQL